MWHFVVDAAGDEEQEMEGPSCTKRKIDCAKKSSSQEQIDSISLSSKSPSGKISYKALFAKVWLHFYFLFFFHFSIPYIMHVTYVTLYQI